MRVGGLRGRAAETGVPLLAAHASRTVRLWESANGLPMRTTRKSSSAKWGPRMRSRCRTRSGTACSFVNSEWGAVGSICGGLAATQSGASSGTPRVANDGTFRSNRRRSGGFAAACRTGLSENHEVVLLQDLLLLADDLETGVDDLLREHVLPRPDVVQNPLRTLYAS